MRNKLDYKTYFNGEYAVVTMQLTSGGQTEFAGQIRDVSISGVPFIGIKSPEFDDKTSGTYYFNLNNVSDIRILSRQGAIKRLRGYKK